MRYPNHFHENIDHPESHLGEQPGRGGHRRGHGRPHRGGGRDSGHGMGRDMNHSHHCGQHDGMGQQREGRGSRGRGHEGHGPRMHGHQGHGPNRFVREGQGLDGRGQHPQGGDHRRPTLERSIVKSARRIRRSDLSPEQLHRRIAATVSHADYVTTVRTLRRIGAELRTAPADAEPSAAER